MTGTSLKAKLCVCLQLSPLFSPAPFPFPLPATCFNTHVGLMTSKDREGQQRKPVCRKRPHGFPTSELVQEEARLGHALEGWGLGQPHSHLLSHHSRARPGYQSCLFKEIKAQETRECKGGTGKEEKEKKYFFLKRFFWYLFSKPLTKTRFEVWGKKGFGPFKFHSSLIDCSFP